MKKVIFIIPRIGRGGAERVVVNIANQMAEDGYAVSILTIMSGEECYALAENVQHIHLGVEKKNKLLQMLMRYLKIRSIIKHSDADTVVAFDRYYGIFGSLFTGKRVIGSERNDPYSNMPQNSIQKYIRDWLYKKADFVVFQTEYARDYFSDKIKRHSTIIANPVSDAILPEKLTGNRDNRIVTACRLTEQKNLYLMIDAFAEFNQIHLGYKLVIYGEGHLLNSLKDYATKKGVSECVEFPGYVNNLPNIISSATMYVSSSDYEGISNSMLEALAVGLPTVCTDCPAGGAAMVIKDGENGFLVPVKDVRRLSEAMCRVVENPERTRQMSVKAMEVRTTFSIQEITKKWENVL
ncbi:MAG: glycosyltransferase [Clostridia bacterium]|nr:glycosyltransferase [Clostridia bacterium]